MFHFACRFLIGAAFLIALASPALTQAPLPMADIPGFGGGGRDYREYFKKPENVREFWDAMQFEMEVGRFDLAARHLKGLVAMSVKTPQDLMKLEEKEGMSAFLKLQNVPRWSADRKLDDEARKDAQELVNRVRAILREKLSDVKRIQKFARNLSASPEERGYAFKELYRVGAPAVPYLLEEMQKTTGKERDAILTILPKLRDDTVPPLLAALGMSDQVLRSDVIRVLRARRAMQAVPYLLYLSASPRQPESIRQRAAEAAAVMLEVPVSRLPLARVALTREAERYYRHEVTFADPNAVTIWRLVDDKLVTGWPPDNVKVTAGKAEEFYGLRFARMALDLDARYRPAQVVFLSLALEKAYERANVTKPLLLGSPEIHEMLTTIQPELVNEILDRALTDRRTLVVLGAVQVLGNLNEVRAIRPSSTGEPPLVRALNYPDRRVQMAAAHALIRTPGSPSTGASVRVLEVLRRAVAAAPGMPILYAPSTPAGTGTEGTFGQPGRTGPGRTGAAAMASPLIEARTLGDDTRGKVLVGFADDQAAQGPAGNIEKAGFQAVIVSNGRDIIRRLNAAADIDALVIDSTLPEPGLAFLLAQLRADFHAGHLPILLTVPRENDSVTRLASRYRNVWIVPQSLTNDAEGLRRELTRRMKEVLVQPIGRDERKEYAEKALWLMARVAKGESADYDVRSSADTIIQAMRTARLNDDIIIAAIEIVGRLPGRTPTRYPQSELAGMVLDASRSVPVRSAAAVELVRHIQTRGALLSRPERADLYGLLTKPIDPFLRANVANVVGSMQRDPTRAGDRLFHYDTPPPAPVPAKPPAGPPGEKPPMTPPPVPRP